MDVKIYVPHDALRGYVMNISTVDASLAAGVRNVTTPYPPTPFQTLLFYCKDSVSMAQGNSGRFETQPRSVLVGPQVSRVNIRVADRLRAIRVDFRPGGLYRLLGVPMYELLNGGFDARDIFGSDMVSISDRLDNVTLEQGKAVVEAFLLEKLASLKPILPFDSAIQVLLGSNGRLSVEQTASLACLSTKQFERKCKERLGMNPKMYSRILRFSRAYRLHEASPRLSWTAIAHEAGYFDQMHMIREFRDFAGVNPSVIEHELRATPLRMQRDIFC